MINRLWRISQDCTLGWCIVNASYATGLGVEAAGAPHALTSNRHERRAEERVLYRKYRVRSKSAGDKSKKVQQRLVAQEL